MSYVDYNGLLYVHEYKATEHRHGSWLRLGRFPYHPITLHVPPGNSRVRELSSDRVQFAKNPKRN